MAYLIIVNVLFEEMALGQTELLLNASVNYARWYSKESKLSIAAIRAQRNALEKTIRLLNTKQATKLEKDYDARILLPTYQLLLLGTQGLLDNISHDDLPTPAQIEQELKSPAVEAWCERYPANSEAEYWRLEFELKNPLDWPDEAELKTMLEPAPTKKMPKVVKEEVRQKVKRAPQKVKTKQKNKQSRQMMQSSAKSLRRSMSAVFEKPWETIQCILFLLIIYWLLGQAGIV